MKLLNHPQLEESLRAMERATARTNDVCDTARAGRYSNARSSGRATPAFGSKRASRPSPTPAFGTKRTTTATATAARPRADATGLRGGVAGVVGVVGVVLLSVSGCPRLPPVSGCTVGEMSCEADRPRVCSASQRWEPAGDRPCSAVGGACVVDDAGTALCRGGAR